MAHNIFERVLGIMGLRIEKNPNNHGETCTAKWMFFICFVLFTSNHVYSVIWKQSPDFVFTGSFLDIVFGHYSRQEIEKKQPPKILNEFVIASFCLAGLDNINHGVSSFLLKIRGWRGNG